MSGDPDERPHPVVKGLKRHRCEINSTEVLGSVVSIVAMPALYAAGSNVAALYLAVFVVYWCYGTQLSVNGVAAADFWGTRNAGINYGLLFTAWGVAGIIGPRIGGVLYDKYHDYQAAFYTAAALAAVALLCELTAKRPAVIPVY